VTAKVPSVSIVIPVFDRLAFTRQCLDRLWRHASAPPFEVIVVDNGSTDGTREHFETLGEAPAPLRYVRSETNLGFGAACNQGARLAAGRYLLFLNNDTLVRPGWLQAMIRLAESDPAIGIVGIQQLFPYTNLIHHTGIVFTADGMPQHLYPHSPTSLPHVNKERDYQAVNGACLLAPRALFEECGGFDEGYRNGYEDVDLCLAVREKGRRVVCCTSASIYHYGQITETRTVDDGHNARRFREKWGGRVRPDEARYFREDVATLPAPARRPPSSAGEEPLVYLADDLGPGTAFAWSNAQIAAALARFGQRVSVPAGPLSGALGKELTRALRPLQTDRPPVGGTQVKWSHYWPQHLGREIDGDVNLELFAVNYAFSDTGSGPWDPWMQSLRQNHRAKLPISGFCRDVLVQAGVPRHDCFVLNLGYSPEIEGIPPARRRDRRFRILAVTNSHDLERYGTALLLDVYREAFRAQEDVALVIHDYGSSSGDPALERLVAAGPPRPRVELHTEFLPKEALVRLYRSCDAFVSPHRGEGFGMKILDALACGLPAIVTDFGGSTDFCTAETALPVAFDLVPLGPCLDARSLALGNAPVWAEPSRESLRQRLRWVYENQGEARALGERAARAVRGRLTWDAAARRLLDVAGALRDRRPRSVAVAPAGPSGAGPAFTSPHWRGVRVSVVIPTFNRKEKLLRCLDALRAQTVLPEELEVLVVDDGSSDGTGDALAAYQAPFDLRRFRQANQGPGAARNLAIREARGEHVLFLGDDIYGLPHLVEEHLEAHARLGDERGTAVLGHVDWEPSLRVNAVMRYVCGEGTLQYAYRFIPHLPSLDWRFFYTSNVSARRRFLVDAAEAGIVFDPCFRHAAFEDSEYAWRLSRHGLRIEYAPSARAVHDHPVDLAGFSAREERAGRMAVVFCRKHPAVDPLLEVFWIAERTRAVQDVARSPSKLAELEALDRETDETLARTVTELEARLEASEAGHDPARPEEIEESLNGALRAVFDTARTRGKVREWYAGVRDERLVEAAVTALACARKLQQMRSPRLSAAHLAESAAALARAVSPGLALPATAPSPVPHAVRSRLMTAAFAADRRLQRLLVRPGAAPLRPAFGIVRRAARWLLAPR
jgi:GT2 family glycosyltransferase/glycosyltransferase involved in cell wall biosynthesis